MSGRAGKALTLLCVVVGLAFFADHAHAQGLENPMGSYTGLLELVQSKANGWADKLRGYALTVFWSLAVIQFVWTLFPLAIKQADFGEIVGEVVRLVLVIGFFYTLLVYSVEWANAIVDSFRQAAASAANVGKGLNPGDVLGFAVKFANTIANVNTMNPLTALIVALTSVIVLFSFGFIAAFMGLTLIESYIVINASVLFMGFGGSQWTREYAIAMARYAVAVGAKLFVLTLLVGLVVQSATEWQAAYNGDKASMWTMIGLSIACGYLTKQIPDLVQSLITGTSLGGGSAIGSMAAVAATAATAAVTAMTAGAGGIAAAAGSAAGSAGSAAGGAGAAGAAASGGGGIASGINSIMAGGAQMAGSAARSAGGDAIAKSLQPRVGGGAQAAPRSSGQSSGSPASAAAKATAQGQQKQGQKKQGDSANAGGSTSKQSNASAENTSSAKQAGSDSPNTGGTKKPPSKSNLHGIADGAVRLTGALAALSVPGMESTASLSLGPRTGNGDTSDTGAQDGGQASFSSPDSGPENTIAPASEPASPPVAPDAGKAPGPEKPS